MLEILETGSLVIGRHFGNILTVTAAKNREYFQKIVWRFNMTETMAIDQPTNRIRDYEENFPSW